MAKKLFLDIETLRADGESLPILEKIYSTAVENGKKMPETFDDYLKETCFDGAFGKILCIGVAVNNDEPFCISGKEKDILKTFWDLAKDVDMFIGHNIFDFDLRFILQRSVVNEVRPSKDPRDLNFARYRNYPIYDTMYEWSKWNMMDKISLDKLARALGLESSKDGGIDGSKVQQYYEDGREKEIYEYCKEDVRVTRDVYKKLNFEK